VARQVAPLNDLLGVREQLKDLLGRTEGNDRLEEMLKAIIEKPELRDKLKDPLGAQGPQASSGEAPSGGEG
jgi:type VI secretion system protein ImpB